MFYPTKNIVGTTEAAFKLGICTQRLRKLLQEGRVKDAQKVGRFWQIPLIKGMPEIIPATMGPKGTWRTEELKEPIAIHIYRQKIQSNRHKTIKEPPIILRRGKKEKTEYYHEIEIGSYCKMVYRPGKPLDCGAEVWLEVNPYVQVFPKVLEIYAENTSNVIN